MSQNRNQKSDERFSELVNRCDELIKSGQISEVAARISKLNFAQIPRSHREALAKICRRSGLIENGLRILQPVIRNERELIEAPRPGEICEYAVLLSRNGSVSEALALLAQVDSQQLPEASLYRAFCHISSWNYEEAAYFLNIFLNTSADPYSKLIARVNLASALIALGQLDEAIHFTEQALASAVELKARRLVGNCLELRGQTRILMGQFNKARSDLEDAVKVFAESQSYDQLLILKWQAILQAFEDNSIKPLESFKSHALQRRHWESVREADLFMVKLKFDQIRFDHLYFGSSYPGYRERILEQLGQLPSSFYILGKPNGQILDLETGRITNSRLNPGKKIHQLLSALTKDFYQPRTIGHLFSELYPDEFFNIDSSPLRVHQLLNRSRRWCEENQLSLKIANVDGAYRIDGLSNLGIIIPLDLKGPNSESIRLSELQRAYPFGVKFKVLQACESLNLSRSQFHRLMEAGVAKGLILRSGVGKSTTYEFVENTTKAA